MKTLRRLFGIFVMIAGVIGLALSLAGLVGLVVVRPGLVTSVTTTIATLNTSVDSSQKAMQVTGDALAATVDSVDALSDLLGNTATTVQDTQPVFTQLNAMMGKQLPDALLAATDSLKAAEQAAQSLEGTIKSLDNFKAVMAATPFLSAFVPASSASYNPDRPLADSLGELAVNLKDMPDTFTDMSADIDKADDNLVEIQTNLTTMSDSVAMISNSLTEYQLMIEQSQSSMDNLHTLLGNIQANLNSIVTWATLLLGLFFLWLLVIQVVVFSQGWELYQGTAGRMEGGRAEATPAV